MKTFQSWVSDMAGSIEDKSVVKRESVSAEKTPLQIRYDFATLIHGLPQGRWKVGMWLKTFCNTEEYDEVIGQRMFSYYSNTDDDDKWFKILQTKIASGWMPSDVLDREDDYV